MISMKLIGVLIPARHQRVLCRRCKVVAGFAILRLQHGVIGRSLALVVSDDGVQPAKNRVAGFSDMIEGKPTLSADFHFAGPHTLVATTWKQQGSLDDKVRVTIDLEDAFAKLAPASD
jgi:hypothetical protein